MKVLSIEQINKLKELGIDVNPKGMCLMYTSDSSDNYYLKYGESTCEDDVKAFTLQDIIELLPKQLPCDDFGFNCLLITPNLGLTGYVFHYTDNADGEIYKQIYSEDILQSAYEMLIWVIENCYLKTKQNVLL